MPNVRQAPVPSEPHPHHLILCTVLYMFMCVTVCTKLTLSVTGSSAAGLRRVEKERDQREAAERSR